MAIIKFKPIREAFKGKIYQKLLKPGTKKVKATGRQSSVGGTPEYYRKKYKSVYGRFRYSPLGETVAKLAQNNVMEPVKLKAKQLKGNTKYHAEWLKRKIQSTPGLEAEIAIAPAVAALPPLMYYDYKTGQKEWDKAWEAAEKELQERKSNATMSDRKTRSDKGKKRGKYRT